MCVCVCVFMKLQCEQNYEVKYKQLNLMNQILVDGNKNSG